MDLRTGYKQILFTNNSRHYNKHAFLSPIQVNESLQRISPEISTHTMAPNLFGNSLLVTAEGTISTPASTTTAEEDNTTKHATAVATTAHKRSNSSSTLVDSVAKEAENEQNQKVTRLNLSYPRF